MTSFLDFHAFAASRGDGLRPEIKRLLDRVAFGGDCTTTIREDGMLQSGPDPKSDYAHMQQEESPGQTKPEHLNDADPKVSSVMPFIRKQAP